MVTGARSSYMTLSRAGDEAIRRKTKTPLKQRRVSPRRASITKTCQRFSQIIPRGLQRRALFFVGHMTERRFVAPKPKELLEEPFADSEKEQPRCSYTAVSHKKCRHALRNACATCETCWAFWPTTPRHTRHVSVHN